MSDIRWCFTHNSEPLLKVTECPRYFDFEKGDCDVRPMVPADPETQVVLPKGEYYEPMFERLGRTPTGWVKVSDG